MNSGAAYPPLILAIDLLEMADDLSRSSDTRGRFIPRPETRLHIAVTCRRFSRIHTDDD
jgi:hypothetical protein